MDPITIGLITAAIYDGLKNVSKTLAVPNFNGFIVECIDELGTKYKKIGTDQVLQFISDPDVAKLVQNFKDRGEDPQFDVLVDKFEKICGESITGFDPKSVLHDLLQIIENKLKAKPDVLEKIQLLYLRRIEQKVENNSIKIDKMQEIILQKLTEQKIETEFDLSKKSIFDVIANFGQINKILNSTDQNWKYEIHMSGDKISVEIKPKNLSKIDASPYTANVRLKMKNDKAKSLMDLIYESKGNGITLNADEIEEFSIYENNKLVYKIEKPKEAQLKIEQHNPLPRLVKLRAPNSTESLEYILLTAVSENGKITLTNKEQKNCPFSVDFQLNREKQEAKFTVSTRDDRKIEDDLNFFKFVRSVVTKGNIEIIDMQTNSTVLGGFATEKIEASPDQFIDIFSKIIEIQKITNTRFPWPQNLTSLDAMTIIQTHQIMTKGEITGSVSSTINISKNVQMLKTFIEPLAKRGYVDGLITNIQESVTLLGVKIDLGFTKITTKITTDEPPNDVVDKYYKLNDNDTMPIKFISLGNEAKIKFNDWPKIRK